MVLHVSAEGVLLQEVLSRARYFYADHFHQGDSDRNNNKAPARNGLQQLHLGSHKGAWKPTSLQRQYTHTGRE